jgi:hypothetical protein
MDQLPREVASAVRLLVDAYRDRCLWHFRRDYYPATREEALGVLEAIERQGDREAFRRAAELRSWL